MGYDDNVLFPDPVVEDRHGVPKQQLPNRCAPNPVGLEVVYDVALEHEFPAPHTMASPQNPNLNATTPKSQTPKPSAQTPRPQTFKQEDTLQMTQSL